MRYNGLHSLHRVGKYFPDGILVCRRQTRGESNFNLQTSCRVCFFARAQVRDGGSAKGERRTYSPFGWCISRSSGKIETVNSSGEASRLDESRAYLSSFMVSCLYERKGPFEPVLLPSLLTDVMESINLGRCDPYLRRSVRRDLYV